MSISTAEFIAMQQRLERNKNREPKNYSPSQSPVSEPAVRHEPLATVERTQGNARRFQVRITSYRRRLLDPDNLAGGCKYFVDCCRYAKLIPDDRPQDIILETRQEKVKLKTDERTEIEIEEIVK